MFALPLIDALLVPPFLACVKSKQQQTYHDNRSSHAFAYADARSADHARLALKGVSPRVIHGLGAGSGGGAETEGLTRQAYARLAAKRAEETAKQRRKV